MSFGVFVVWGDFRGDFRGDNFSEFNELFCALWCGGGVFLGCFLRIYGGKCRFWGVFLGVFFGRLF